MPGVYVVAVILRKIADEYTVVPANNCFIQIQGLAHQLPPTYRPTWRKTQCIAGLALHRFRSAVLLGFAPVSSLNA